MRYSSKNVHHYGGINLLMKIVLVLFVGSDQVLSQNAKYSIDVFGVKSGTTYVVNIAVGTPLFDSNNPKSNAKNTFRMVLDTGSSNDAILAEGCCKPKKSNSTFYSCKNSMTCKASDTTAELKYTAGKISGKLTRDSYSGKGFAIQGHFMAIDAQNDFYREDYDGITGFAYKSLVKPTKNPPRSFYNSLVEEGRISDTFGLLLCGTLQNLRQNPNSTDLHSGQLVVGGLQGPKGEKFHKGSMFFSPIVQEMWYVVTVTDVGFGGESLGLPCETYNTPNAIIDSGTSNIALPQQVYAKLMARIKKATLSAIPKFNKNYFNYEKSCCGVKECDPTNFKSPLVKLPSIYFSFALGGEGNTNEQYMIEIPPEYYWRPERNGKDLKENCRAIGIAEGDSIVLGDAFMDGLYTYHDRAGQKIGLAVADNCPNKAKSTKKINRISTKVDWCNCLSSEQKKESLVMSNYPWATDTCFFMVWWMYVVIVSFVVTLTCFVFILYLWTRGKKRKKEQRKRAQTFAASVLVQNNMTNDTEETNSSNCGSFAVMESPYSDTSSVPFMEGSTSFSFSSVGSSYESRQLNK